MKSPLRGRCLIVVTFGAPWKSSLSVGPNTFGRPISTLFGALGCLPPRALGQTSAAIFVILRQERRPRPKPRPWAESIERDFGHDPLLDHTGQRMKWVRRVAPKAS